MPSCCIRNCDSYKHTAGTNIAYFKFPMHDVFLLKRWLRQMNLANWKPSENSRICSAHFKEEDVYRKMNTKHLLPASVPTIFPIHKKTVRKTRIGRNSGKLNKDELELPSVEIVDIKPQRNEVSSLKRRQIASEIEGEGISATDSKQRNKLSKPNAVDDLELLPLHKLNRQKSYLRIILNRVNVAENSKPAPFETVFLPNHEDTEVPKIVETQNEVCVSTNTGIGNSISTRKSAVSESNKNQFKPHLKEYSHEPESKNTPLQLQTQDHIYSSPTIKSKVQSPKLKSRQASDQLRRRLEELRARRQSEQLKIVSLQMDLIKLEKKMEENNQEEIVVPDLGQGNKPAGIKSSWLIREKEEYEKLLKDVREIKLKVLRERHNREMENIKKLQIQMSNLRKKMKENDEKEIAFSRLKETNNSAIGRPDWMIREEEEYEKLLEDVRKIKESYKLRETKKNDNVSSGTTRIFKFEKILSTEDCTLIEAMQEESRLIEKAVNGDGSANNIRAGISDDDKNEYGEIIGEIDEDSIDIDMSKEETMLTFNEELPDPGLLES